ncbi:MAG: prenyltransferase [Actinomycetes bacterium]
MSAPELPGVLSAGDLIASAASIAAAQEPTGLIPWEPGGHADPWDHVECAMALDVCGFHAEATAAYRWLQRAQHADGYWASKYQDGRVENPMPEANHAAYAAVGVWHHWRMTHDEGFLRDLWPTVTRALDFVLTLQAPGGQVWWAADEDGHADELALLTANASIHQALRAGLALADHLDETQPDWELAVGLLRHALLSHPDAFADKSRFSMDWYYPILGGAVRGGAGLARIAERWDDFVVPGLGVRCVAERPWVTGAETCELALALDTLGERERAIQMVSAMQHLREADGSYWTGYVFEDDARWPVERSTWTAAAVILAVDAINGAGPQAGVFRADDLPLGADVGDECPVDAYCRRD